jgi:hypothetical protein
MDHGFELIEDNKARLKPDLHSWFVDNGYEYRIDLEYDGANRSFGAWLHTSDEALVHLKMVEMLR